MQIQRELTIAVMDERMRPTGDKLTDHMGRVKLGKPTLKLLCRFRPKPARRLFCVPAHSLDVGIRIGNLHDF